MTCFEDLSVPFSDAVVFLDIDGTIVADGKIDIDKAVKEKLSQLKKNNQVYLTTNSRKTSVSEIEKQVGISVINKKHKKPSPRILEEFSFDVTKKKIVIGDKFLTDGLFAKRIGAQFIKVKRKVSHQQRMLITASYVLDDFVSLFLSRFLS